MMEDAELLRRYAEEGSEAAFTELVRRRLDLVYAVALRQTGGDSHRAEDVAQAVFTDLARKAKSLIGRPVLAGWLYRSTQYAASSVMRAERSRQAREQASHTMNEISSEDRSASEWDKLRPDLDQIMSELDERDRDALVLRFFDDLPFTDIGLRLRLTENAARMCVERALDKMRCALARRGVKSTTAALAVALTNQVGIAAPAGLVASVSGAAFADAAASGSIVAAVTFMTINKLNVGIMAGLVVAGATGLVFQNQTNAKLRREVSEQNQAMESLRVENQRLAKPSAELVQLRQEHAELGRLRDETAALRQRDQAQQAVSKATGGSVNVPVKLVPAGAWKNAGLSTPAAAVETLLFAAIAGEVDLFTKGLVLDEAAKAKADRIFAKLTPDEQAKYGSPEKLTGLLIAHEFGVVAAMQFVSAQESGSVTAVTVRLLLTNGAYSEKAYPFRQTADGWHLEVPAKKVDEHKLVPQPATIGGK